ncbi:MAG: hypothetical protein PHR16_02980 [Methylovulum sp.]|nr:hypothetical protein [Methylovulum sp.]
MTEILFILTTIFVAYVVYEIAGGQQPTIKVTKPKIAPVTQAVADEATPKKPQSADKEPLAGAIPAEVVKVAGQPITVTNPKGTVRDPKTGEVTKIANNYRFVKRWIKEALVAEGLLEKVYKNNELDEPTEMAIKQALIKFEVLDKYRA